MNCKPGDLAVIVRNMPGADSLQHAIGQKLIGYTVRVTRVETNACGYPTWWIETPIFIEHAGRKHRFVGIEDVTLQAIRGIPVTDDVKDEVTA